MEGLCRSKLRAVRDVHGKIHWLVVRRSAASKGSECEQGAGKHVD
jgi:hypothetical protein